MSANDRTPGSMLEVYMHALASRTNDDFLDEVNLGVGNYTDAEYWQQVETFRKGLFADAGVTRVVMERAIEETKRELVAAIYGEADEDLLEHVDHPDPEPGMTKRRYLEEHGDEMWRGLGHDGGRDEEPYTRYEHQAYLISEVTGIDRDWVPPHWRMLKMRHEASRSKGARLIDNLFGRPPEPSGGMGGGMAGGGADMAALEDFE